MQKSSLTATHNHLNHQYPSYNHYTLPSYYTSVAAAVAASVATTPLQPTPPQTQSLSSSNSSTSNSPNSNPNEQVINKKNL